ncbi:hypothetical protein DERP_001527 [Dermatophagoides pteronyssinus]|uniref:Uncharacterized protein n=1 Tax=Dermatophagoides pteronyssinus TaxID=6956 RepID=A0ABQ8JER1_DERPT|nr:hypothetical protein DERP_001527 [Dermatophagoides pteronyssinus]
MLWFYKDLMNMILLSVWWHLQHLKIKKFGWNIMSKFAEHNPIQPLKKKIVFEVLTDDNLTTTNKLSKYYQVLTAYFF